jgi:CHAD domain-containing protein
VTREPALPRDLLERPAGEAARRIALAEVARAEQARLALDRGEDPEALHDLRVALRRLRSDLRAFRGELGDAVPGKLRRRVRRLAAMTNPGRDAEVGAALLAQLADGATGSERRAADVLAGRLGDRRDRVYRHVRGERLGELETLLARLRETLGSWRVEIRLDGEAEPELSFRAALGAQLARHAGALLAALERAREAPEPGRVHRVRIEAKRLRYLLEPVAPRLPAARAVVTRLRHLQDLLGAANDLAVVAAELAAEAAEGERSRVLAATGGSRRPRLPGGRAGRSALARRIAERRDRLAGEFGERWLAEGAPEAAALVAGIAGLVDALAEAGQPGEAAV